MLIAMRKHTKVIFWIIIILIVPAFVVFYVPSVLRSGGGRARYGTMFGEKVTEREFFLAQTAERMALSNFDRALRTMKYREPGYDFLQVRRELALASIGHDEEILKQRQELLALYTGRSPEPIDLVSLERAREILTAEFTDPETGNYDEAAYTAHLRKLGMTDEEYLAEFRDNLKILQFAVWPILWEESERGYQSRRQATWGRLLLAREAKRLDIPVSDDEILNYLYLIFPGEDGRIDEELYRHLLRRREMDRAEFEREVGTTIRIAKLQRMILESVKAPAEAVRAEFDERYKTEKLAYLFEPYEPLMEPQALRDDEVLDFYVNHRTIEAFQIKPRVAVTYVLVETKDFYAEVDVPDEELKTYYEAHADAFAGQDGAPRPYEACADEVRAAVVEAEHRVEAEKLARAKAVRLFSVGSPVRLIQMAARRGYEVRETPLFGEEGAIDEVIAEDEEDFRNAAFGLDPGEVSGLIKVEQGWCVLSPTQVVPDPKGTQHRPFDEVKDVARTEAARARARELTHELSVSLFERTEALMDEEGVGFTEACSRLGLDVAETGFLASDDEEVPGLEDGQGLIFRAFVADKWVKDEIIKPKDAYVIGLEKGIVLFHVLETRLPDEAMWAEKGPAFRKDFLRLSRNAGYQEWVQQLFFKAAIKDDYDDRRRAALDAGQATASQ